MPSVVLTEIFQGPRPIQPPAILSAGLYPAQLGFMEGFVLGDVKPEFPAPPRIGMLHRGERAAIEVALELQAGGTAATVLVNERGGYNVAKGYRLAAVSVPDLLVILLDQGILQLTDTEDAFRDLLAMGSTPLEFMKQARNEINSRGGRL